MLMWNEIVARKKKEVVTQSREGGGESEALPMSPGVFGGCMSGSAVVTLEQRVPLVALKLPRPLLLGPGGRLAAHEEESGQENALVVAERAWFAKRLREGLTR